MNFDFHQLSEIFPLLEGKEFEELCADIKQRGLCLPILMYEGKILDGRNRYRACRSVRVEPFFEEYVGDDALGVVVSLNLARRHLNDSQRALIAGRLADHPGANVAGVPKAAHTRDGRPVAGKAATGHVTKARAAELLNVSRSHVRMARDVLNHADPETIGKIERGQIKIGAALKPEIKGDALPTKKIINAFGAAIVRQKGNVLRVPKEQRIKIVKKLARCLNLERADIDLNSDISGADILAFIDFLQLSESRLATIPLNVRRDMARQF